VAVSAATFYTEIMSTQQRLRYYLRRFRHITLTLGVVILAALFPLIAQASLLFGSHITQLIIAFALPYIALSFYLCAQLARQLGYRQPVTTLIGGGIFSFGASAVISLLLDAAKIENTIIGTTLMIASLAVGFWLADRLPQPKTPLHPRTNKRWPIGRFLAVGAPALTVSAIVLSGYIYNAGMEVLWVSVIGIILIFMTIVPCIFALVSYYHKATLILAGIAAPTAFAFFVSVVIVFITAPPTSPLAHLPEWVKGIFSIASLLTVGLYVRDYEKIPKK
jgi:small-conductance mechanosensitive channel